MTALLEKAGRSSPDDRVWSIMPGWGVVADLTPPELHAERRLHLLRRRILVALTLLIVLCGAAWGAAFLQDSRAVNALESARADNLQVIAQEAKYSDVTRLHAAIASVEVRTSTVLRHYVDLAALLTRIRGALPHTMSLSNITATLDVSGPPSTDGTTSLDPSARPHIGTVSLMGTSRQIADVGSFVDRLDRLPGVVDVLPTSNMAATGGVSTFAISFAVTDRLYRRVAAGNRSGR